MHWGLQCMIQSIKKLAACKNYDIVLRHMSHRNISLSWHWLVDVVIVTSDAFFVLGDSNDYLYLLKKTEMSKVCLFLYFVLGKAPAVFSFNFKDGKRVR